MKENPLSSFRQQMIVARVNYFVELASELYQAQFPIPKIVFDLAGHSVGMYLVKKEQSLLRFNPWIFDLYFEDHFLIRPDFDYLHCFDYLSHKQM